MLTHDDQIIAYSEDAQRIANKLSNKRIWKRRKRLSTKRINNIQSKRIHECISEVRHMHGRMYNVLKNEYRCKYIDDSVIFFTTHTHIYNKITSLWFESPKILIWLIAYASLETPFAYNCRLLTHDKHILDELNKYLPTASGYAFCIDRNRRNSNIIFSESEIVPVIDDDLTDIYNYLHKLWVVAYFRKVTFDCIGAYKKFYESTVDDGDEQWILINATVLMMRILYVNPTRLRTLSDADINFSIEFVKSVHVHICSTYQTYRRRLICAELFAYRDLHILKFTHKKSIWLKLMSSHAINILSHTTYGRNVLVSFDDILHTTVDDCILNKMQKCNCYKLSELIQFGKDKNFSGLQITNSIWFLLHEGYICETRSGSYIKTDKELKMTKKTYFS